jgi:hypothetical protein
MKKDVDYLDRMQQKVLELHEKYQAHYSEKDLMSSHEALALAFGILHWLENIPQEETITLIWGIDHIEEVKGGIAKYRRKRIR